MTSSIIFYKKNYSCTFYFSHRWFRSNTSHPTSTRLQAQTIKLFIMWFFSIPLTRPISCLYSENTLHPFWRNSGEWTTNTAKMTPTGITVNVSETGGNKEWEFYILHLGLKKQQAKSYVNTWMPVTLLPKTIQLKTSCFRWNCTNSKFKRPCFSSCQCCVHTRMI